MALLTPSFGLFFWALVIFLLLLFLLRKFAWKPILTALYNREESIAKALNEAKDARAATEALQKQMAEAEKSSRLERDAILKEANAAKERIVNEAKAEAHAQAEKLINDAREQIQLEKTQAIAEMKTQAAELAILVAEKVLRKQLADQAAQKSYAETVINDFTLN